MSRSVAHPPSDTSRVARPARRVSPGRAPDGTIPGHVFEALVDILASAVLADMTREPAVPAGTPHVQGPTGENRTV